ncbi:sensor histidine kinase [Protaetiibacter intestinalis]|uniref:histidine kinase n=1 Tax=Protaetiibacter intestinalis TaxID=2419774 RepID=A0A387B788_9MICO|nr:histidine kinase [Protaetiibacter intestinalis]AYF97598.1 sensor histidine kinase [Protaetiibacter intestinalis]
MLARLRGWLRPASAATADGPFTELDARRLGAVRRFFVQHPVFTDVFVALWFTVPSLFAALVLGYVGDPVPDPGRGWILVAFAFGGGLVLLRRRREPVLTVAALVVLLVACLALTGETGGFELAIALGMYAVAAARPPAVTWLVELGAMLVAGTAVAFLVRDTATDPDVNRVGLAIATIAIIAIGSLVAIAIGISVRGRRQHIDSLIQRANALAHDRAQSEALAVAEERTRIARELHDVVAHSLTVMVALADGARAASASDPEGAARALDALTETGRSALDDMRRVLGVLREPGSDAPLEPEPDVGLDELVARFRAAGLAVRIVRSGVQDELPVAVRRSIWRIVQESLTNVLRYAPASPLVLVELTRVRDAAGERFEVRVTNQAQPLTAERPTASGTGRGIIGMRERAASHGGTVDAGPHERGWQVHAVLPLGTRTAEGETR